MKRGKAKKKQEAKAEDVAPQIPPSVQGQLNQLKSQIQVALAFYRADLRVIELMRRTLEMVLDDGASLLEMSEEMEKLPLSKESNEEYLPMMPPVYVLNREAVIRLKIEEAGDEDRFHEMEEQIRKFGTCVEKDDKGKTITTHDAEEKIKQGCGALMWAAKSSFGVWKMARLLEKIGEASPDCLDLKMPVMGTGVAQSAVGRLWFHESIVLRCDILLIDA